MMINVDRTSVAKGDDVLPHAQTIELPPETSLARVVAHLLERHFLATIAGGKATWILVAGDTSSTSSPPDACPSAEPRRSRHLPTQAEYEAALRAYETGPR